MACCFCAGLEGQWALDYTEGMTPSLAVKETQPRELRLSLFGRFQLQRDGETVRLPTRKVEGLLAYLALHPEPHAREK